MGETPPEETQESASGAEDMDATAQTQTSVIAEPVKHALEDMFDDDDDDEDDEFSSSAPVKAEEASQEDQCVCWY